jgi:hypothetical protein
VPTPRSCHFLIASSTSLLLLPPSRLAIADRREQELAGRHC